MIMKLSVFLVGLLCALGLANCDPMDTCDCPAPGPLFTTSAPMAHAHAFGTDGDYAPLPFGDFEATVETSPSAVVITYTHGEESVRTTVRYSVVAAH